MTLERRRARRAALALTLGVLAGSCAIQTEADDLTTDTTLAPPTTDPDQAPTTADPNLYTLTDAHVRAIEIADYDADVVDIGSQPGSESIYLASREGFIYEIKRDAKRDSDTGFVTFTSRATTVPFLNLSGQVNDEGADQGFHGFAFSSDGARLYVSFTNSAGATQIDELRVSNGRVSPTSQRTLLEIDQQDTAQNAGPITMGPDGFLYIPLGDGGGRGDPFQTGQNPTDLHGSVLRIDPEAGEGTPYNIPLDNPYDGEDGAREVYITGLRDPSSVTFDSRGGNLWITDRGQDGIQEINLVPPGAPGSAPVNLGWSAMNGADATGGDEPENHTPPLLEYDEESGCGVVGGAVYRNGTLQRDQGLRLPGLTRSAIPGLYGAYVYGDHCTGHVFAIQVADGAVSSGKRLDIELESETLSTIGTDPDGELVIATTNGRVLQLVYSPPG